MFFFSPWFWLCARIWFHWIFGFFCSAISSAGTGEPTNLNFKFINSGKGNTTATTKTTTTTKHKLVNYRLAKLELWTKWNAGQNEIETFFFFSLYVSVAVFALILRYKKGSKIDTWLMLPHLFSAKMKAKKQIQKKKTTLRENALRKLANGMSIETEKILRTAISYLPSADSALADFRSECVCLALSILCSLWCCVLWESVVWWSVSGDHR